MTAITVTELSVEDVPMVLLSGTAQRRVKMYLRFTSATTGETLDLSSLVDGLADIEGILFETDDGAAVNTAGTSATWSTVTLTSNTAGVEELCIMGVLT